MHILQLVPQLSVGGVERGVLDMAKGLLSRGHRVSVVSDGGPLVARLTAMGAVHHELPVHKKSLRCMSSCVPALSDFIRSSGVDIVHARSRVPAWIGWIAARQTQRPFVTTAHGFYSPSIGSRVMVWGRLIIVPSESLGRYLIDRFGVPRERLRVIPRGVDLDEFRFSPPPAHSGTWRLGLFGRLSPIKGHEVALEACARLVREGMPVKLCFAGDAPDSPLRHSLSAKANKLRLEDAIEWLGVREDMPEVIASVDMVTVPSVYPESFGRAVVEAQAVGRPVIASRLGALAELIEEGKTGLLVPPGDADALADAVKRYISSEPLRQQCVEAARKRVESEWTLDRMVERTLAVYEECLLKPKVLVWKLSALGDVVLSTPSLRAIRKQFPNSSISLVVSKAAYEVVARCPYLDQVLVIDRQRKDRGHFRRWGLIRRLRDEGYDISIDLQNSRWTHVTAWAAGIMVRIGFRRKFGFLLNRAVVPPKQAMAPVQHQHHLLTSAGIAPDGEHLELWPSSADEAAADTLLKSAGWPDARWVVGIHPGGSGKWKTKRWPLARWQQLSEMLRSQGVRLVITGGPEERALAQALAPSVEGAAAGNLPLVAIGKTRLLELACLIKRCHVFVAHDSFPLHLAAAVGTPAVALFGPTDPARHLPPAFDGQVLVRKVFCSPCYSPRCKTLTHACMQRITLEDVFRAVMSRLPQGES